MCEACMFVPKSFVLYVEAGKLPNFSTLRVLNQGNVAQSRWPREAQVFGDQNERLLTTKPSNSSLRIHITRQSAP